MSREIKFRQHNKYNPAIIHLSGYQEEDKWTAPKHVL